MVGIRRGLVVLAVVLTHWPVAAQESAVEVIIEGDEAGDPFGVELGPDGALYFTDIRSHRVLRVDLKSRRVTVAAGSGQRGYVGDAGLAVEAAMDEPYELRFDGDGHMLIADIGNHRIRRVDLKSGVVETIAGNGEQVLPVDGQTAAGRPLIGPRALFVAGDMLWIALREGHSVWRMSLDDGVLHHVAGVGRAGYNGDGAGKRTKFTGPKGIAVDKKKYVYVVDSGNEAIRQIDAERERVTTLVGGPDRVRGTKLSQPHGICVGPDGTLYIGDTLGHRVLRVVQR